MIAEPKGVLMAVIKDRCVLHLTPHNNPPGTTT